MKVDHDDQVNQLFQAAATKNEAIVKQKRFLYKLMQKIKDGT